jgi:hypothetical protein
MVSMLQSSVESASASILVDLLSSDSAMPFDSAKRARLECDPHFLPKVSAATHAPDAVAWVVLYSTHCQHQHLYYSTDCQVFTMVD